MSTLTSHFSLTLPTLSGDNNTWGTELNNQCSTIDSLLFSLASGAMTYAADTSGAANTITATIPAPLTALVPGLEIKIKLANTVSNTTTLNLNGLGAQPVTFPDGTPLMANDALAGKILHLVFDGTNWQYLNNTLTGVVGHFYPSATTTVDSHFLICNGATFSRTGATLNLYNKIGTTWGSGDGATTANLPNWDGKALVGAAGTVYAEGVTFGDATHLLTISELPSHTHADQGHTHGFADSRGVPNGGSYNGIISSGSITNGTQIGYANLSNTGGGAAHNNLPPSMTAYMMIRF